MSLTLKRRLIAAAAAAALCAVSLPAPTLANGYPPTLNTWVARGATDGGNGPDNGTSCEDADYVADGSADDVELQAAIDHTLTGGTVHICAGTYRLASHLITTQDDLRLVGTGGGAVTIDGSGNSILRAGITDLTLERMTLQNAVSIWVGGAVQARSFVATDVAFINNVSKPHGGFGGALYSFGDVTLNRVSFIGNNTDAVVGHKGGAIYISNGVAVIRNSTFENNRSDDGGAIYAAGDSAILVSHSTFRANRATGMGGALYSRGVVDSRNARYVRNRATIGGAIFVAFPLAGTTDLLRNRFVGNRARVAGGALAFNTHCYSLPKRLLAHALRANRFTSNSGRRTPDLYRADLVASPCF